ncbi:MAG: hypothetical protein Q2306_01555 [Phytoplasma sp.]|uniref:hypothetical protein n=1 Tax=Phytoplasma sp. TaxID=2155 RepID=UPI002B409C71|nr:hypothetical protein [Phytoplasma sp.]WRH06574.1 MAG: hypothetical protein Q2306_01555 [Phytoplasma sp.]
MIKKQNKFKFFILFLIITILFSLLATSIYFFQRKTEEIRLEHDFPTFEIELIGGNHQNKYLIPISIPNLNKDKYEHLINIEHKAILHSKSTEIKEILFLKITLSLESPNITFENRNNFFAFQFLVTDANKQKQIYSDDDRPCYVHMQPNNTQTIIINTQLQQKDILTSNHPKLYLIYDYELVDKQGKSITGGTNIVTNRITNVANN